jgi:hypothetical protein
MTPVAVRLRTDLPESGPVVELYVDGNSGFVGLEWMSAQQARDVALDLLAASDLLRMRQDNGR